MDHFDSSDKALLIEVLDATIQDLGPEIAGTDNPEYRRMLKERRDRLVGLRNGLGERAH